MKFKNLFLLLASSVCFTASAQLNQRFDNINYKALYLKEASKLIANDPNLLLLDVRSPGEYADTLSHPNGNIGRLKGAINISIDSIEKHLSDLEPYKDKNILVYCSHSQRSRVVSKFLTDHGFKHVNSLNGGMSLVNKSTDAEFPAKASLFTINLPYKLIQSEEAYKFISNKKNVIIDLRPPSQFNSTDSIEINNIGRMKSAINIPANELDSRLSELEKYKEGPLLLYDLHNSESVNAALKLKKAGFKNVYVLYEGLATLMVNTASSSNLRKELFINLPGYKVIGPKETIDLVNGSPNLVVADIRPANQFMNKSDVTFTNLGHIQNAVSLPDAAQLYAYLKDKPKSTPVLIYGSGMINMGMADRSSETDGAMVCKQLTKEGYSNIYFIYSGLYSVVWSVTNVENCRDGFAILTDHNGLY